MQVAVVSDEIADVTLYRRRPLALHLYAAPFLAFYPLLAYAYFVRYDTWIKSEEWTFVYTVTLVTLHALSFLVTRWSVRARAVITAVGVDRLEQAEVVRVLPHAHKGNGELVPLERRMQRGGRVEYSFVYLADKYVLAFPDAKAPATAVTASPDVREPTFRRLHYPVDALPQLSHFQQNRGLAGDALEDTRETFGGNALEIPVPRFLDLFAEHAVAPFFVFQVFCVGLWLLDEYWWSSLFTLFGLVMFECTVVFQRQRTLNEFRTMSIQPYTVYAYREHAWKSVSSAELLPGDVVSVTRSKDDSALACDMLLLGGSAIVNEAMLSGESTPLLKEGIQQRDGQDHLDHQGDDRLHILFGGTKTLQVTPPAAPPKAGVPAAPDGGAPAVVLRTGFGTTQGRLIRLMVFSNENQVSANNLESFVFIAFLLVFAIAASAYVWRHGVRTGRPKGKLLLHCVLIITSVVPPELPMELSMAVNASLVALARFAIFCTEPFRIPFAGRVDVCCFDKTGTITGEDLEVQGVIGASGPASAARLSTSLDPALDACPEATLVLASAHALVLVDDEVVGDPMERRAVDALGYEVKKGDYVVPTERARAPASQTVHIRTRFHFSSALKRMAAVSQVGGKNTLFASVKGAPEVLKSMFVEVPENYDEVYRSYTRRGSRVIALGYKWLDGVSPNAVRSLRREEVESKLHFAGFLALHCPLKPDAVDALRQLNESSHRCVMITGDNALTAVHIAEEVDIVTREALILDRAEGSADECALAWRSADAATSVDQDANAELHRRFFDTYDVCVTGPALRAFEEQPAKLRELVHNTSVYARVSPAQKELIVATLKDLGYITLMAGDGTNDVGALKTANIGVALLDGTEEDLQKIATHQRNERLKRMYETQLNLSARFSQPPPPVPPALREVYPHLEEVREKAAVQMKEQQASNPAAKFDLSAITSSMGAMEGEEMDGPPQIRLGDASVAAPFTSKLSNVGAICSIIRQGRCTLVATIQMYKILALNCLIQAYSLSVLDLDGVRMGDYQMTVSGVLISICFYCISRGQPIEKLAPERPVTNILNVYVFGSILTQTALHLATMVYIQRLSKEIEPVGTVDPEAKFSPTLLNTGVFLLSLSQTVSTFAVNYIGRPWRESIRENKYLYYGLLCAGAIAYLGVIEAMPEVNAWLQLVKLGPGYQQKLLGAMLVDLCGCYVLEAFWWLFADVKPRPMIARAQAARQARAARAAGAGKTA